MRRSGRQAAPKAAPARPVGVMSRTLDVAHRSALCRRPAPRQPMQPREHDASLVLPQSRPAAQAPRQKGDPLTARMAGAPSWASGGAPRAGALPRPRETRATERGAAGWAWVVELEPGSERCGEHMHARRVVELEPEAKPRVNCWRRRRWRRRRWWRRWCWRRRRWCWRRQRWRRLQEH